MEICGDQCDLSIEDRKYVYVRWLSIVQPTDRLVEKYTGRLIDRSINRLID